MTHQTTDLSRDAAWSIVTEFIQSESLRRHCLSVETAMRAYARLYGEPEDEWGLVGLLHDFDYEIHPTLEKHPQDGAQILQDRGYPDWVIRAILSHADHLDVKRESKLELTLAAVDELTGFIVAVAFVRPSKAVKDVTPEAVRKKMKDKAFARAINRAEILASAEALGVDFDQHVQFVIDAMAANAESLGLAGVSASA